jgi:hypothetical protein
MQYDVDPTPYPSPQARRGEILLLWRELPKRGFGDEVPVIFEQIENRYKKII